MRIARTGLSGIPWCRRFTSWAPLAILIVLLIYRPATTWPGFVIVLLGIPVFLAMRRQPSR